MTNMKGQFYRAKYYKSGFKNDLSESVLDYQFNKNRMKKIAEEFVWQKELKSFIITFIVGFVMVIYTQLDTLTLDSLKDGSYVGVIFAGVRAGIKGAIELFLSWYDK